MKPTLSPLDREAIQQIQQAALDLLRLGELIARADPALRFDLRAACLGR